MERCNRTNPQQYQKNSTSFNKLQGRQENFTHLVALGYYFNLRGMIFLVRSTKEFISGWCSMLSPGGTDCWWDSVPSRPTGHGWATTLHLPFICQIQKGYFNCTIGYKYVILLSIQIRLAKIHTYFLRISFMPFWLQKPGDGELLIYFWDLHANICYFYNLC